MLHRPTMLMILDGYGLREETEGNAIFAARTPNLDNFFSKYPTISLEASGTAVGLPEGQMGNSEVGHLNIGAGNIIYQNLLKISRSIDQGSFFENEAFLSAIENAKAGHALHIMGLLSDGGVHSHIEHIKALVKMASMHGLTEVYLHCFLDGRDVPPTSAVKYLDELSDYMKELGVGKIGVISGRFYAMDRDKRWDRLQKAYDALTLCDAPVFESPEEAIKASYENDQTDEFVVPVIINKAPIKDGDSVIFANFRPDRAREITRALVDEDFDSLERKVFPKDLCYVCMAEYDQTMPNVKVAFPPEDVYPTLGKTISKAGLKQLRIAETEKYAHVTFFLNGGTDDKEEGEDRILIPSPKVETYDLKPEMSAVEVCDTVIEKINNSEYDVYILNFANPDMVGHTGVFDAAVKAIETVDTLAGKIADAILEKDGQILLTADHGNADYMIDKNGNPITKHSVSKVPLCHICNEPASFKKQTGKLSDIAPTLLTLMGVEVPSEMKGEVLV